MIFYIFFFHRTITFTKCQCGGHSIGNPKDRFSHDVTEIFEARFSLDLAEIPIIKTCVESSYLSDMKKNQDTLLILFFLLLFPTKVTEEASTCNSMYSLI